MSAKIEANRRSFHRQQMALLPRLIPGLDPDPPVLLCEVTGAFDHLIIVQLKRNGWPATGKTKEQFEADPPAPVKGAVLARKLARGNDLTSAEIDLLTNRIKWLQRNPFRWEARDGYAALAAAKRESEVSREPPGAIAEVGNSASSDTHETAAKKSVDEAEVAPRSDPFHAVTVTATDDRDTAATMPAPGECATNASVQSLSEDTPSVADYPILNEPNRPAEASELAAVADKCETARAALNGSSDSEDFPSFEDYGKAVGVTNSHHNDARFVSLRTGHIKSVEGEEVRSLLYAIFYRKPPDEIHRRAKALAADKAQLSAAMSGPQSTREDIIEAFAKLGLEADV